MPGRLQDAADPLAAGAVAASLLSEVVEQSTLEDERAAQNGQPERGVRLRAHGVVDLRDHARDGEGLAGQLGHEDVAVVALGQGQEDVGSLEPGPPQDVFVDAVAAHGVAPEVGRQAIESAGGRVEDGDLVPGPGELPGEAGTDTPATHDHGLHLVASSPWGSRTTHTAVGAFAST